MDNLNLKISAGCWNRVGKSVILGITPAIHHKGGKMASSAFRNVIQCGAIWHGKPLKLRNFQISLAQKNTGMARKAFWGYYQQMSPDLEKLTKYPKSRISERWRDECLIGFSQIPTDLRYSIFNRKVNSQNFPTGDISKHLRFCPKVIFLTN